ncbi:NUDIX domain-containing protein [Actinokineospora cianjurensis]|uniref:NUDIX domain-containing protein n=1 Tax=Actinokineospora cianjurensis TaxID=585224 RepID=A0A421B1U2_9PSEU|nr:NUDIX domain-containing protein [Actinokineospora cianjurensis]RLK58389.1 NUDIX domain-containing protein [Actinokineospora cianjurensis]
MTKLKHSTASTFVFHRFPQGWRLGLVVQPRLGRHMIVGGHVEADETAAEAAVREAMEESGLGVRLVPGPAPLVPMGYPHPAVVAPWWVNEMPVPADNHLDVPHVHMDHQYLALAESLVPEREPAHPFGWYGEDELAGLEMFDDTRMLAGALFPIIDELISAGDAARSWRVLESANLA